LEHGFVSSRTAGITRRRSLTWPLQSPRKPPLAWILWLGGPVERIVKVLHVSPSVFSSAAKAKRARRIDGADIFRSQLNIVAEEDERYSEAVDRRAIDGQATLFASDAVDLHGLVKAPDLALGCDAVWITTLLPG